MLNLNCVICAELFTHSDEVHVTTCGHMFHFLCLKQWMERSKTCPQCRHKCNDRNHFRVYFNVANLDVSRIDVCSLQEQLDNATLQCKLKEKESIQVQQELKDLKDRQKKCLKTITGLEKKMQKNDFLVLSYSEQVKTLTADNKVVNELRQEVKSLQLHIKAMESVSTLLTSTSADAENLLKIENDPHILSVWVTTLRRELRRCESKKTDSCNMLRVVQSDLRKEIENKRINEERISRLESENFLLSEKLMEAEKSIMDASISTGSQQASITHKDKRATISPTIKENIRKIEDSNSPYWNIKSSSIGLVPLLKRNHDIKSMNAASLNVPTTTKVTKIKLSPMKSTNGNSGAVLKTESDLSEKYSIFKKPRLGTLSASASAGASGFTKPLGPNFVFNGFGGSQTVSPFETNDKFNKEEKEAEEARCIRKLNAKTNGCSLSKRLKNGNLRNFKITK